MLAGGAGSAGAASRAGPWLGTLIAVAVVYVLALIVVFTALGSIFRAAVYVYATTGVTPSHMDADPAAVVVQDEVVAGAPA